MADWRGSSDPIVDEPVSPMAGWQVAPSGHFGGGPGAMQRFEFAPVAGGHQSLPPFAPLQLIASDAGLQQELDRQAVRAASRLEREDVLNVERVADLPMNILGGGGFGGFDRRVMEHVVPQPAPVSQDVRINAPQAAMSRMPVRCNASQYTCVCFVEPVQFCPQVSA